MRIRYENDIDTGAGGQVDMARARARQPTYLDMRLPGLLGSGDGTGGRVVEELGVLAKATPETKFLARIIRLVDEMALCRVCAVLLAKSGGGTIPSIGLEGVILAQA